MTRKKLIDVFFTGLIIGIDNIFIVFAFATLIFQGVLKQFIPLGINIFTICSIIISISYVIQASTPYAIAQIQDEAVIFYSALAMSIVHSLPGDLPNQTIFLIVLLTIGITTLSVGFLFYLIGKLELGNIIRYLPYPVMGGFLAASGGLMFYGSLLLMIGNGDAHHWTEFFSPSALMQWLPACLAGLLVYLLKERGYQYILQISLVLVIIIFYFVLYILDLSPSSPQVQPYMLDRVASSNSQWIFEADFWDLSLLKYSLSQFSYSGLIIFVSFIALLLNASSIELITAQKIDLNRELRIAGKSNMLGGIMGGTVGYLSLSATQLAKEQHVNSRFTGLIAVIPLFIILFFGMEVVWVLPKVLIGTFLFYVAFSFLYEWLVNTWESLSLIEYLIIIFILIISIAFNILTAVLMGTIISIFIFAFRYSMIHPVKYNFSGMNYHSSFQRSPELQSVLYQYGYEIRYLKLQGFLFFGSVYSLFDLIQNITESNFVILDFELVDNIDSSRIVLLENLKQLAINKNIIFILCHVNSTLTNELVNTNEFKSDNSWIKIYSDKEKALQWCENQVLKKHALHELNTLNILDEQLFNLGFSTDLVKYFKPLAIAHNYSPSELIFHEGEQTTSIYIIHRGQVSVLVGQQTVLTVGSGNVLGEIAMYTNNQERSATLQADEETIIYEINIERLNELAEINPSLVSHFHMCMARILAKRLIEKNEIIKLFSSN